VQVLLRTSEQKEPHLELALTPALSRGERGPEGAGAGRHSFKYSKGFGY